MTDFNPGDSFFEIYRIERLIDTGPYGEVFLVTHLQQNTPRVVKILRREAPGMGSILFSTARDRFRMEAQLGGQINHPRLVKVYELHESDGILGLAMEYAPGGCLEERLSKLKKEEPGLAIEASARILLDVAEGLAVLHDRDMVHRNLSLRNILFDQQGSAKVADLGFAQVKGTGSSRSIMGSSLNGAPAHPGTIGYMSPEQKNTMAYLNSTSDVYALGLILFEMLTSKPYSQVSPGTHIKEVRKDTPAWLDDLSARMLHEDRDQRPWDGAELVEILKDGLEKGPSPEIATAIRDPKPVEVGVRINTPQPTAPVAMIIEPPPETRLRSAAAGALWEASGLRIINLNKGADFEMVHVPEGEFLMGSDKRRDRNAYDTELPQHKVFLPDYWIGRYPVTNEQYLRFIEATCYGFPIGWKGGKIPPGQEMHPVVNIRWEDTQIFCNWLQNEAHNQGRQVSVRLPTEAEWEKAARGTDGRIYPWGDRTPDEDFCNFGIKTRHTTPVGNYSPQGDSPYGCADMVGNMWEWTVDWYSETFYQESPVFNPGGPETGSLRSLRGGSWISGAGSVRLANRGWLDPCESNSGLGFRCVMGSVEHFGPR